MSIVRFNPIALPFLFRELERECGPAAERGGLAAQARDWQPLVDIRETADAYRLEVELPAVDPKDVRIAVEEGHLKVTGERRAADAETAGKVRRSERPHGTFMRSFRLPEDADADAIRATAEHGIIAITVGKSVKARARQIAVETA